MLQLLRVYKGTSLPTFLQQDRDEYSELERLEYSRSDNAIETSLIVIAEKSLRDARYRILVNTDGNFEAVKKDLRYLADITTRFGKKNLSEEILFAINTLWGLLYSGSEDWVQAIKSLNSAISFCPRSSEGIHLPGLSDSLVLLSESYSSLGKWEDAVHSARLAVVCAHKRMAVSDVYTSGPGSIRDIGALLDGSTSLLATYYTLAVMLERSGASTEMLALEWYARVVRTAGKMVLKKERAQSEIDSITFDDKQGVEYMYRPEIVYNQINDLSKLSEEARSRLQRLPSQQKGYVEERTLLLPRNIGMMIQLAETGPKIRPQSALPRLLSDPAISKLQTIYPPPSTDLARNHNYRNSEEDYGDVNLSAKEGQGQSKVHTHLKEPKVAQMNKYTSESNHLQGERKGWCQQVSQQQFSVIMPTKSLPSHLHYDLDLPVPQFISQQQQMQQQESDNEFDYHTYLNNDENNENIYNFQPSNNEIINELVTPYQSFEKAGKVTAVDRTFIHGYISPQRLSTLSRSQGDMTYIATACSTNRKRGRHGTYNMFAPSPVSRGAIREEKSGKKEEEQEEFGGIIKRKQEGRKGRMNRLRLELKSLRLGAALVIQRAGRGYISRIVGRGMKKQKAFELRRRLCRKAVLVIQRILRGHQSRARGRVRSSLFDLLLCNPQIHQLQEQESEPEVSSATISNGDHFSVVERGQQSAGTNLPSLSGLLQTQHEQALKRVDITSHKVLKEGKVMMVESKRMAVRESEWALLDEERRQEQEMSDLKLYQAVSDITRMKDEAVANEMMIRIAATLASSKGEKEVRRKLDGLLLAVMEKERKREREMADLEGEGLCHGDVTKLVEGTICPSLTLAKNGMESKVHYGITVIDVLSATKNLSAPPKKLSIKSTSSESPSDGNASAASMRRSNQKDMQQHMLHVFSQISIQKAQKSRKMHMVRFNKVIMLQALARGYIERRRHRGLLRHIGRGIALSQREIALKQRERTVLEHFEGLVLSAQEEEEIAVSCDPLVDSGQQVREASVISDGLRSGVLENSAGISQFRAHLDSALSSKHLIETPSHYNHNEHISFGKESEQDQSLCLSESGDQTKNFLQPVSTDINHDLIMDFVNMDKKDECEEKDCPRLSSPQLLVTTTLKGSQIDIVTNFITGSSGSHDIPLDQKSYYEDDRGLQSGTVEKASIVPIAENTIELEKKASPLIVPITEDTDFSMDKNKSMEETEKVAKNDGKVLRLAGEKGVIGALFKRFSLSVINIKEM